MTPHAARVEQITQEHLRGIYRRTDIMFGVLLALQFVAGIAAALLVSPRTWAGSGSTVHLHVWTALTLGGCLTAGPILLILFRRGEPITRYTIAAAQMLFSALLIHLTGGRIETHFHVFGSLAFLSIYRDWRVLVPATVVVFADHLLRAMFWPQSVFGVIVAAPWRAFEHAGWVIFENIFLTYACVQSMREIKAVSTTHASLESAHQNTELIVRERTHELEERSEELRVSRERFALALDGSQDGIWDWDLDTDTIYFAPRWKKLLGLSQHNIGNSPEEWFSRIASEHLAPFHAEITSHVHTRGDRLDIEIEMIHADGNPRWMRCRAVAVRNGQGVATRLVGSLSDFTELKLAQEELRRLAQQDRLTGLANRHMFKDRLREAIERARTNHDHRFAVLFFDFDRFKIINDSLGHAIGDELLRSIGARLRDHCNEHDVPARFGGDEFALLLCPLGSVSEARERCQSILESLRLPHIIQGHAIVSSASAGIATSDHTPKDADVMVREADAAMYEAKAAGGNSCMEYDSDMHERAVKRLNIEQDLHRADTESEFSLLYQPIVSLATGKIRGFESLIRWLHPTRGTVQPDSFITVAEETGVIVQMGEWAFQAACQQLSLWQSKLDMPDLRMSVNLSRRQLIHPELTDRFADIARNVGVNPATVTLEITESSVMDDRHSLTPVMQRIQKLGFGIAMDDFGTGHSSLSCLHRFPIQSIKIDRSFIRNMQVRREFTAIMHAIIALSKNLGLDVVAEGVEIPDQLAQLQSLDCDYGQGFLFAPPLTPAEATAFITKGAGRRAA